MKNNIVIHSTKNMSEAEWLAWRQNGVGGSDVGTVMMLNEYKSRFQLYEEKAGLVPPEKVENELAFWGTELEAQVAEKWQYYDGVGNDNRARAMSMINNFNAGKIIRKCRKINAFAVNPDYPILFASVDRLINKNQIRIFHGDTLKTEGILEAKTIRSYVAKKWEDEIPPMYAAQLQTYLLVYGVEYGEMAILRDGGFFDVIPFEKSDIAIQAILSHVEPFWDMVLRGRQFLAEKNEAEEKHRTAEARQWQQALVDNEPEPDGTAALETYLKTRFQSEPITIKGELEQLEMARMINKLSEDVKKIESASLEYSNKLRLDMREAEVLDFGDFGKVTWMTNKNGTRTFRTAGVKKEA